MQLELVMYDLLVRPKHLQRKIDKVVDFGFIYDLCAPLYCADNGCPAVDPEILFRMQFVGYLYGIRGEVRLCEEVQDNVAYRWFCGVGLTEKVPNHAKISANRQRRFRDNNIAEQIFNEILRQATEMGLVGGNFLYTDSTHVKAKANQHKKVSVTVEETPKAYMKEPDAAVEQERKTLGKKPFDPKDGPPSKKYAHRLLCRWAERGCQPACVCSYPAPFVSMFEREEYTFFGLLPPLAAVRLSSLKPS